METRQCGRCRTGVLVGLSNGGRALAQDVTLDLVELTPLGELDALHSGRRTWTVHAASGHVYARDPAGIGRWPAGQVQRQSVHADHRCRGEEGT
jgi:hypothetical protein